MAIVYRGLDNVLGRTVAIKTMLPQYASDPSFAARFKQEAQAAAALQSPYIVSVYDWGKDGDTYYIIMEYLRGTDLKSGIRKHGALDSRKVAQIGSQIASALSVAHQHDIIHRDIKPQNIMVQPDGNIKVMDFGIARAKNSHLTADNSVLGTAHYVSPEQTQGKDLEATSDLYSLGVVMYEAATGRVPFEGEDAISVALKQVNELPVPPSQVNPRCDPYLERIILKCMQKNPADRFQTADELKRTLNDYVAGHTDAVANATSVIDTNPTRQLNQNVTTTLPQAQGTLPVTQSRTSRVNTQAQTATAAREEQRAQTRRRRLLTGLLAALVVVAAIVAGAIALRGNSTATEQVPNLIGLTQEQAETSIRDNGFEVGTVKESFSSTMEEGRVVDQDPDPSKVVSRGAKISIVISKGTEPKKDVTVPKLENMTPPEAEAELTKLGLRGRAGDPIYSETVESGRVAAQDPAPGTVLKEGDTVSYQFSKGPDTVEVPNVAGYSEEQAVVLLAEAGFGVATTSEYSSTVSAGNVIRYSPAGRQDRGETITLVISLGEHYVEPSTPATTTTEPTYTYNEPTETSTPDDDGTGTGEYTDTGASDTGAGATTNEGTDSEQNTGDAGAGAGTGTNEAEASQAI